MRIGILANSIFAAMSVCEEVKEIPGSEVLVLLCPMDKESSARNLARHCARVALKSGRWKSLCMLAAGKVVRLRKPLEDSQSIARLKSLQLDLGLHKSGNIYRRSAIDCFRLGILNAHIGLLPKYRGRSVMEWSLVQGDPVGISVFFVDEGIDTGRQIVFSETVDISDCKSIAGAKQYLFDLAGQFYRRSIERLSAGDVTCKANDGSGRRYYVMSKLFETVAQNNLAMSNQQSAIGNRK